MGDCNKPKKKCQDLKRLGTIYLIINLLNGKMYVGKTVQKLEDRIKQHYLNKSTSGIDGALKKYGLENFKYEIIEECPIDILEEREKFWIAFYNCKAPNGYNLTDGGEGISNPSPETRARLSAASKGRPLSASARENLSIVNSGEGNPFFGKHHTEETKANISKALTGRKLPKSTCEKMSESRTGEKNHFFGKHHTKATRDLLSNLNKGENNPNYGKTGEKNPNYGKSLSEETRKKMSESQKARWAKKKADKNLDEKNLENQND